MQCGRVASTDSKIRGQLSGKYLIGSISHPDRESGSAVGTYLFPQTEVAETPCSTHVTSVRCQHELAAGTAVAGEMDVIILGLTIRLDITASHIAE